MAHAEVVAELVFIPAPGVGHMNSAVELAKVLLNRDHRLSITILLINTPKFGFLPLTSYFKSLAINNKNTDRIRFIELPQDHAPEKLDPEGFCMSMYEYISSHSNHVRKIVSGMLNQTCSGKLVGFVVDMFGCTCMIDVANEFNVPAYVFQVCTAAFLGFNLNIVTRSLDQNQDFVQLSKSETEIVVPSFVHPVPTKVFPGFEQTQDGVDFLICSFRDARKAKGIIVNTFLELETHALKSLADADNCPTLYPVGPLVNLDGIVVKADDMELIRWLDDQPPCSVVFLGFGSMGYFDEIQVKEIARALEQSGHRFVWSLRKPPPREQSSDPEDPKLLLPDGFLERTAEVGKVIEWAPQVALLAHKAIAGYVSHCGWPSFLESLWFDVPIVTWPIYGEQQINAFEMVMELGLAVELTLDFKINVFNPRDDTVIITQNEIESGIRRVMEDNKIRAKVKEMGKMSRTVVAEGGSSYASVGNIIQNLMSNII